MAAPADALSSMDSQPAQPQAAPDAAAAQPAQPQKPSLWHNVLHGALAGLEQGGVVGAAMGAADPKAAIAGKEAKQEMQAAKVRFADAQAASLVAQEHARQVQLAQQEEQIKLQAGALDQKWAEAIMNHGGVPVATTHDDSDAAHTAGLQSVSDAHPNGIPNLMTFKLPSGQTIAFRMGDVAGNQGAVHMLNLYQAVNGQTPTDSATLNNKSLTTPAARDKMFAQAKDFMNPVPKSDADLQQKRQAYKNYLANAKGLPDSNPLKAESVVAMQKAVDMLDQPWKFTQASNKPVAGMVNGKMTYAVPGPAGEGYTDQNTGQHLTNFQPAPAYAQVALSVAQERNKPQEGKMAEDVFKPALDADWRLGRMTEDYQHALKGDQQAMVSLLTNHIGMTLGLQKGARITKDILHEAQNSLPYLQGVEARWDGNGYLSGVVLSPEQMQQMLTLAHSQRQWVWRGARSQAEQLRGQGLRVVEPRSITQESGAPAPEPVAAKGGKAKAAPAAAPAAQGGDFFSKFGGQARQQ